MVKCSLSHVVEVGPKRRGPEPGLLPGSRGEITKLLALEAQHIRAGSQDPALFICPARRPHDHTIPPGRHPRRRPGQAHALAPAQGAAPAGRPADAAPRARLRAAPRAHAAGRGDRPRRRVRRGRTWTRPTWSGPSRSGSSEPGTRSCRPCRSWRKRAWCSSSTATCRASPRGRCARSSMPRPRTSWPSSRRKWTTRRATAASCATRSGRVARIVEERDATEAERAIREVNTGIVAAPFAKLKAWLAGLTNDNVQGEYYLTDIVAAAVAEGFPVAVRRPQSPTECLGVNSQARARPARKARPDGSCPGSPRRGRDARRPRAHRRARRAHLRARRVHRRELHLRGQGRAGRRREDRRPLHPARRDRRRGHARSGRSPCSRKPAWARTPASAPTRGSGPARELADEVHIGNFVEVKASTLGRGQQGQPPRLRRRRDGRPAT